MSAVSSALNFSHGYPAPGPQWGDPQQIMDHVFFLSDTAWKRVREEEQFDYIVVGSSFCAYAFAQRILSAEPARRILIIERGPFFLPQHFQNLPLPYQQTLGGLSETFPWTLSARTAAMPVGDIQWQHGSVPFFGGRSTMWSAWCPRPTAAEMRAWPQATIAAAQAHFASAEQLLNVVPADQIDAGRSAASMALVAQQRPAYGLMQTSLQQLLAANLHRIESATRWLPAPLAVGAGVAEGLEFAKFSTPAVLLELANSQALKAAAGHGSPLRIVTNCIVQRILQQDGVATALDTSRGMVNIGAAKVILAMGTLPPTTLLMNAFPQLQGAGERFTAHFVTSIVARVRRDHFDFGAALAELELAALYIAGENPSNGMQYHVQLSVLSDRQPQANAQKAARYMPDVVATASTAQLASSADHLVFVCAVLGETDEHNPDNFFRLQPGDDPTTNALLQVLANANDRSTWDAMDESAFQMLERVFAPQGEVEYWHGEHTVGGWSDRHGSWRAERPAIKQRRAGGLVHEGSTLPIGAAGEGVVGLDYRPHNVANIHLTGAALWPTSGSWNPTLTMVALAQDLADQLLAAT